MSAMNLFSCPLCGESIEIPDLKFEAEGLALTCPICGSFVDDDSIVAVSVPNDEPRLRRECTL